MSQLTLLATLSSFFIAHFFIPAVVSTTFTFTNTAKKHHKGITLRAPTQTKLHHSSTVQWCMRVR
ncbi:hypothetical protein OIU77_020220 [Salix suchowensis]|uniref:Secreted protein n=1 Tax=Salix suchowensis TaxID=1278906 RepID=A0ABQ9CJR3_9ROSI|nr:hypothetical protein OIU77_020220 [Salix suchowensis]